ncbi:MAG: hypothetical protein ACRCVW_01085 [Brevinema sp.]
MKHSTRKIFGLLIFLFLAKPLFGFYDLFQADPTQYKAHFKGSLKIESLHMAYENTNAVFYVDYAMIPQDHTDQRDQRILKWVFTKLYNHNLSSFFVDWWYRQFDTEAGSFAYSVQLRSGQLILVDKRGRTVSQGSKLQVLMPIIDLSKGYVYQNQSLTIPNSPNTVFITTEGWDFFNVRPTNDIIRPMIETNTAFIRGMNKTYSTKQKKSDDFFYWMQAIHTVETDSAKKNISRTDIMGFYIMNKKTQTIDRGVINLGITFTIPYTFGNFSVPVTFTIDGQIITDIKR